jgi:DNA invertase Pin-like site-specific DNA recombinase
VSIGDGRTYRRICAELARSGWRHSGAAWDLDRLCAVFDRASRPHGSTADLSDLGVPDDRVYLDHGLTGRNRSRPGLTPARAALREGDTLVVPKLDRLARSIPDARAIGDSLAARGVRLSLGGTVYDPADPMGKCLFNILATFDEFEVDLLRMRPSTVSLTLGRK